ncbi:Endopolyphosphatase [Paraphaeosphaeria sporulosa]|uniref:Endopolyphosphatase n=1 Tax=Paraphaeosphaeria sporulosa TaxID=1460663 RepID=A0A177CYA5_9PLEO|nr:Endopolyphosphatase [Paraphaeosphaeria sporulosa]OAG12513.1 Endopolyphosphatase [Paraphaeosphaeria sporulosa]
MLRPLQALVAALLASCSSGLDAQEQTQLGPGTIAAAGKSRPLRGRFLHITDFHPDPHYKTYSSTKETAACHRNHGPAGIYGAETSACDSPVSLVNATLDWIKHNVADDIDFVVWTGDSARHDNDEKHPRTQDEIISQNELMVEKLTDVFGSGQDRDDPTKAFKIPIVPTFGNNDIMPHNILLAGPNKWTMKYLNIWRGFIPEAQRHQFQQGGWFSVEVIPGKLAVISLNTLYFFTSNSAVDGCAKKKEPGYEQFEWLRIQLQIMRDRGMSAILIGHVPPARVDSKESWDETCWQKYALWERQYRDVVVGSLFGHMNIDHFMLQDFHHIKKGAKNGQMAPQSTRAQVEGGLLTDGEITVASASDYLVQLRRWWSKLPAPPPKNNTIRSIAEYADEDGEEEDPSIWQKIVSPFSRSKKKPKDGKKRSFLEKLGGQYAERYSVSLVAPSVVPNYFPTIRVFEYNITGLEHLTVSPVSEQETFSNSLIQKLAVDHDFADDDTYARDTESVLRRKHKNSEKESLKKRRKYKFKVPNGPSKSSPPGPAYSPQTLTFTSYTQYFANLTHINNDFVAQTETQAQSPNEESPRTIFGLEVDVDGKIEQRRWKEGKHGKHQGKKPHVKPHPRKFKFEVEYDTKTDERYKLKDLTVRSFVDLARRIGKEKAGKRGAYDRVDGGLDADEVEADGGKGKKERNKTWLTFVERAFVGTLDPGQMAVFSADGASAAVGQGVGDDVENMEL